ncbi:MAG: alpha amylase N-terminal ig-like domain-containing protein [Phycisphaerales bacterium]|nr:alpha amylase N-terminal ig-like domain-containing protein [Phycisphaerales bacterium]
MPSHDPVLNFRNNIRARRRFAPVLALAGLWSVPFAAEEQTVAEQRINLAGTFNGWATSDSDYQLRKFDDHYEIVRFWPCGRYEFKFVFDGSWKRHWGSAGKNTLTQPGNNIPLSIKESGEYAILLFPESKSWIVKKRRPSKPRARFRIRPITRHQVQLDHSFSLARPGHPIQSYTWHIESPDLAVTDWDLDRRPKGDHLKIRKPGRFKVTLVVEDDDFEDRTTITTKLGEGYELHTQRKPSDLGQPMYRLDGSTWWTVYEPTRRGEQTFFVSGHDLDPLSKAHRHSVEAGRRYLVQYDAASQNIHLTDRGWHQFDLDIRDDPRLPRNLVVEHVDLVGSFNGWQAGRTRMPRLEPGHFRTLVTLPDGVHHYKFLVNGSIYLEDRAADRRYRRPDGAGGFNSGLLIGPDAAELGPAKPNDIKAEAIDHDETRALFFSAIAGDTVRLTVRTLADDVEGVQLLTSQGKKKIPMRRVSTRHGFDYWATQYRTRTRSLDYWFLFLDGTSSLIFDAEGARRDGQVSPIRQRIQMSFETPDWAKRAVWYQIFPERFRNGDPNNDPPRTVPWTHEWYKPYQPGPHAGKASPQDFREDGDSFYHYIYDRRYGGDFQGLIDKLPYLRGLGVTAIYLNPVFQAESLHKYDASDYRHIDDYFGVKDSLKKLKGETTDPTTWQWSESDKVFLEFLNEAHRLGFRVVLDGVFNHVGRGFWAFQDVIRRGKDSPYVNWFEITSWEKTDEGLPFHFNAWDRDNGALPRLKHDEALGLCEPVREHLFAVTRRWMDPNGDGDPSDGIDGWRLDVAGDINANFWKDWRKLVKSINPDAYIVGELWQESREWLDGNTFDAVMNYPFAERCQRFFVNQKKAAKPSVFKSELAEMLGWYLPQVNHVLQNLFASHDTDRPASMFMNPDLEYDKANRLQDNGPNYDPGKPTPDCYQKLKLMVTFQMTFPGAPMVYYGDEVGMYGADDPSCRKPMLWEDLMPYDDPDESIEVDVLDHHRRMIAIRNTYPALQLGSFDTLLTDDRLGVFAFSRTLHGVDSVREHIVVVLNNSDKTRRLNVPVSWPNDSVILRLDDPRACKLIPASDSAPKARPVIRTLQSHRSKYKVVDGRLQGGMLLPRSGGVFVLR